MILSEETKKLWQEYVQITGKRPRPIYIDIYETQADYQKYLREELKKIK